VNIVPGYAVLEVDIRVVSDEHAKELLRRIEESGTRLAAAKEAAFRLRVMSYNAPIVTDGGTAIVRGFAEACGTRAGALEICPYSTDAVSVLPVLGIPLIIYGPGRIQQAHRQDEYIALSELAQAAQELSRHLTQSEDANTTHTERLNGPSDL